MLLRLHLPALRQLKVSGSHKPGTGTLHMDRSSFAEAGRLQALTLKHPGTVSLSPDCFTGLTALVTLKLKTCGLTSVPLALAALAGSLTSLALPNNSALQLATSDMDTLLTLRKLRSLDLRKSGRTPADTWSLRSMQHLVRLPSDFQGTHGHTPDIQLVGPFSEEETEEESEEEDEDFGV